MSARILDVTDAGYFADPCDRPSLTQSVAHILVTESPRHAWLAHPRLGGSKELKSSKAMEEGSVLHKLILGKGKQFEMLMFDDFKTKLAQEARDEAVAGGRIPLLAKQFTKLNEAATRIKMNAKDQGFPLETIDREAELAIEFTEKVDKFDVVCRCRLDLVRTQDHVIVDIKKVRSANPRDIERSIVEYGYDIQHAAYLSAYQQLVEDARGRTEFVFLFCETEPPYEVVPARLDGVLTEIGTRRWAKALRKWKALLEEGSFPWPGYADGAITLTAPLWVVHQEIPEVAA